MTAPAGVIDLSLPDYATLIARAGVNPDAEAQRVTHAVPAVVSGVAAFANAGGERDAAWSQSMNAQAAIGAAFVNDAAPVLDRSAHLQRIRADWAARVAAAGTADGGLIPQTAIPGLLAERGQVAADMAGRVGAAGRQVGERIRGYEVVLNAALRLLADQGFVPAIDLNASRRPPRHRRSKARRTRPGSAPR